MTYVAILAAAFVGLGTAARIFPRRLIYFPLRGVASAASVLPESEDVELSTRDGLRLAGWFVPARTRRPLATVLVCNGNAGIRSYRAPLAAAFSRAGLSVLLFDYRGYGGN